MLIIGALCLIALGGFGWLWFYLFVFSKKFREDEARTATEQARWVQKHHIMLLTIICAALILTLIGAFYLANGQVFYD